MRMRIVQVGFRDSLAERLFLIPSYFYEGLQSAVTRDIIGERANERAGLVDVYGSNKGHVERQHFEGP
jgi:hypothetical protein